MTTPPERASSTEPTYRFWAALSALVALLVFAIYWPVLSGGVFLEKDFLWLSAGKLVSSWLPYLDHISDLFERPIIHAIEGFRPGAWLLHTILAKYLGDDPTLFLLVVFALFALNGILVGIITQLMFKDRNISAAAAVLFVVHPQLAGAVATVSSLSAHVALFWMLICILSILRYKKTRRIFHLVPLYCGVFLSYTTHSVGLMVVPALFFLDLVTLPPNWNRRHILAALFRLGLIAAPVVALMIFWMPLGNTPELIRIYVVVKLVQPTLVAASEGARLLLLPFPMSFNPSSLLKGFDLGKVILFGSPVLLGVALASVFSDRRRIFPLLLIVFGIFFQLPNLFSVSTTSPEYAIPFFVSAIGMAMFLADLLLKISPKSAGRFAVLALVCLLAASSHLNAKTWALQGQQVGRMSDQLLQLHSDLGDTADIYLVGAGKHSESMLAAHLDFNRRFGVGNQTRFSFIQSGFVFCFHKDGPVGESPHGVTRMVLDEALTFLGYENGNLVDLTPLIFDKVQKAQKVLETEKRLPPKWRLGQHSLVSGWEAKPGGVDLIPIEDPSDFQWYVEGRVKTLHPQAGRFLPQRRP